VRSVSSEETVRQFDGATQAILQQNLAPLMQWVDIAKFEEAYKFNRLIAQLQTELIRGGGKQLVPRLLLPGQVDPLHLNRSGMYSQICGRHGLSGPCVVANWTQWPMLNHRCSRSS
jgi:hypothetical protein